MPHITTDLISALAPDIPTTVIVLIIEHIAISKSFGRVNNYVINPSQELVAVGFTNIFGPFLGGYPATGSFSRTAIKSKAGVRTPLAGIFTAILVLLALYALTAVFFYIPSASLSALIIHAVGDLITPPNTVYQFWRTSPIDVVIFFGGVLLSIFTTIENGIYLTVAASAALLGLRIALSSGGFLGRVRIHRVSEEELRSGGGALAGGDDGSSSLSGGKKTRDVYVAIDHRDNSNPDVPISHPYPGLFVYRFPDGFNYINSAKHLDQLTLYVFKETRRTLLDRFEKIGVSVPHRTHGQPPTSTIKTRRSILTNADFHCRTAPGTTPAHGGASRCPPRTTGPSCVASCWTSAP